MSVTSTQAISLLENVLFESATQAKANAAGWVTLSNLNSAYSSVSGLATAMAGTAEASIVQQVVRYYEGALGRAPGGTEIAYYVNIAETGLTPAQIAQGATAVSQGTWNIIASDFANSPEFSFATASASSVVTLLYLNILGRSPSAAEVAYYNAQQASGLGTSTLVQEFVNSPEYTNKVTASVAANLSAYGTAVTGGTTPTTIGAITTTTPSVSFTLTSGQDTQTANVFNATLGNGTSAPATLQGFDALTGAGSSNSLNIFDNAGNTAAVILPLGLTLSNIQTISVSTANNAGSITGGTVFDVSGYSSVTQLTVTSTGNTGDALAAAATTNITDTNYGTGGIVTAGGLNVSITSLAAGQIKVLGEAGTATVTSTSAGANAIDVDDGTNISITANKATTGTVHVGDGTAGGGKPTGTVTVNYNAVETATGATTGAIAIKGGTTVTVNETLTGNAAAIAAGDSGTIGAINITGGATTTSVTVTQSAPGVGGTAAAGKAGVVGVTAVTAAPGVTGVKAVTAVTASSSTAAAFGVTNGAVVISDASNTITSVSLTNAATGSSITSKALTTLTLGGKIAGLTITDAASSPVTLALNLNKVSTGVVNDASGAVSVLNIVTGGTGSSTLAWQDAGAVADSVLTNINVSGTQVVSYTSALSTTNDAALTSVKVSGAAGFKGDISGFADVLTGTVTTGSTVFATTSSGKITLTLDADGTHHQTFVGSTGTDVITVTSDVLKYAPITAGSATNNELILTTGTYTATKTGTYATGFQILGLNNTAGTVDAGTINLTQWATGSAFTTLNIEGADTNSGDTQTVSGFAGKAINFNDVAGYGGTLVVTAADATGAQDAYTLTLADANGATGTGQGVGGAGIQTIHALDLQDANNVGIATLNIATNNSGFDTQDIITTLVDSGLSAINLSGTGGLDIVTLNEGTTLGGTATAATTLTLNNTSTGAAGLTIGTLTDNSLGSITFTGTGNDHITSIADNASLLSLTNSGSGSVDIGTITSTGLTKLVLGAGITLGQGATTGAEATIGLQVTTETGGVIVSGAADNNHVSMTLVGAAAGNTDSITLGNGNNYIVDTSSATSAAVNITVGTGSNLITAGVAGATDAAYSITLGTHSVSTGIDAISVGTAGANFASAPNATISNVAVGDTITLLEDASASTTVTSVTTTGTSIATTIAQLEANTTVAAAHGLGYTTYNGNTFIVENEAAGSAAATTTVIELVGLHTFTSTGGVLTIIT